MYIQHTLILTRMPEWKYNRCVLHFSYNPTNAPLQSQCTVGKIYFTYSGSDCTYDIVTYIRILHSSNVLFGNGNINGKCALLFRVFKDFYNMEGAYKYCGRNDFVHVCTLYAGQQSEQTNK